MQKPDIKIKKEAGRLLNRLTQDVLDVPYYYGSAIMLRKLYPQFAGLSAAQ